MLSKSLFRNILSGFCGQLIVIILGILIPRIMISSYGSDVNGLMATVTQIFSYLALLEAGIGQSARIALYGPITESNEKNISLVVVSAESYFRKVSLYYGIGVLLLAFGLPFIIKSNVPFLTIVFIILLEGMAGVVSFFFIQTPIVLLNAEGRGYINNSINLFDKVILYVSKIALAMVGVNIIFIQLSFFVITLLKVFIYRWYIHKKYSWIKYKGCRADYSLLRDKKSYFITEVAWTIFSSTDIIVLSVFISTELSSVYSIYALIYANINLLMSSVGGSVLYLLGNVYHKDIHEYEKVHDAMNSFFIGTITVFMSISYVLALPFVKLYTRDIADINYIFKELPLLFSLIQILSWSRYVTGNLTGLAGYAKTTSYISLIEALFNLVFSVFLVQKYGLLGVLFATIISLPIKVIWCIYISDKKVLNRSYVNTFKIISSNFIFFLIIVVMTTRFINVDIESYESFVFYGIGLVMIIGTIGFILNVWIDHNSWLLFNKYILNRNNK